MNRIERRGAIQSTVNDATMTQKRCNTPGGIDRNKSVSQQPRMNKNNNKQNNDNRNKIK